MKIVKNVLEFMFDVFAAKATDDTLLVEGFDYEDKHALKINALMENLYCIELSGTGNTTNRLSEVSINNIYSDFKEENYGSFVNVLYKKGFWQKNYIFSFDKDLLDVIAGDLNVSFIDSTEMLDVLYDLFLRNSYSINNKRITRDYELSHKIKYETLEYGFNREVKEAVYENLWELELYQGRHLSKHSKTDLSRLFKLDFEGVVFNYFDFTRGCVSSAITARIRSGLKSFQSGAFKQLREDYNKGTEELIVANSILIMKEGKKTVPKQIGNFLNIDFKKKNLFVKDILKYTMLKKRDTYWDNIVNKDYLYNYIAATHKLETDVPEFYAIDINNSYWNYNFLHPTKKHKNKNAFIVMIGITGTGKTTATSKLFAQLINLDFETGAADLSHVNMRDFDVKYSGLPLADKVSLKNKVDRIEADLNGFKYNLLNVRIKEDGLPDANEIMMNTILCSIVLESLNNNDRKAGLDAEEKLLFAEMVKNIYEDPDLHGTERILKLKETHGDVYLELKELGYADRSRTREITQNKYSFLRKPRLSTLTKKLKSLKQQEVDADKAKTASTLLYKLSLIEKMDIFNHYDTLNIEDSKYMYANFENIKSIPDVYVPIFSAIFNRTYLIDRRKQLERENLGIERPVIYYNLTEADNVFRQPSFADLLRAVNNEARSSRIRIFSSTQLIEQVPEHMIKQSANIICLFPAENKREKLIQDLGGLITLTHEQVDLLKRSPQYSMAIINESGVSVVSQEITDEEIELYGQE